MAKTKSVTILMMVISIVCLVRLETMAREKILYDVPYRNQVLDFPNWSKNWASCGYTSTLMNLLYCEAIPVGKSEQSLIEEMYSYCSTTTNDGSVIFYYEKLDEYCEQYLPEADLKVNFIRNNFEEEIKKSLENEQPVICGTYIFGDVGHVILIVGFDDQNWIVHDPANDWGQECWPTDGFDWKNAAFVRFPIGSFTILYGASIYSEKNKEYAGKLVEQSPSIVLANEGEMEMLWVKIINQGIKDWEQDKIHLGTYQPEDRNCGLAAKTSPEKYRWLKTTNRIVMEQKKVLPGQVAIFGIPMEKNGFVGNFPECFRLINNDKNGQWFGPVVTWNIECPQSSEVYQNNQLFSGNYFYHPGNLHNHSVWSGEKTSVSELVQTGKRNGLDFLGITDRVDQIGEKVNISKYLTEINLAGQDNNICVIAGMEFDLLNYAGKSFQTKESDIKIIGLGYNHLSIQDFPDWFPWGTKGQNVSIVELINWHRQHNLPIIIVNPLDKGQNGWSTEELIKNNLFPGLEKIAGVEVFSKTVFPPLLSIKGVNLTGILNTQNNLEQTIELYKNYLGTIGMGVTGGESPAKTIIATTSPQLSNEQIIEALISKKTAASNHGANFDFIKISDQEWAPGIWEQTITSGEEVKIEGQIRWRASTGKKKCLYIIRNQKLIKKEVVEGKEIFYFSFTDNCYKPGKYSYQIAVCDIDITSNDEKIFTSPIYVLVKDKEQVENQMETVNEIQKELVVFTPTIHLGDSFYEGEINLGFKREKAESISTTKIFKLSDSDFVNLTDCELMMEVCGAQIEKKTGQGNPIIINCQKIGECKIPNEDPTKNNLVYKYNIPLDCLQNGSNELFIRSLPRAYILKNGKTFIDFDDFEIRDIKVVFNYGGKKNMSDHQANLSAKKIPLKNEMEELSFASDQDYDEYSRESDKIIQDFGNKGGKFITESDPRYQQFLTLIEPINNNIKDLPGEMPIKWKLFESNTLDPIALPDRTILVPTGLLINEKELPENKIFPIVSAIFQSDLGISHKQANRKDLAGVLGFLGTVLTKNDNTIAKYVGMGLLLAGSLSLKSEDEDFYIADAYAIDWMKQNGLSVDQAYTILDASGRLEKNSVNNDEYYILAPPADKRLEALTNYIYWQNTYPVPISPEMIDWEKVVKGKTKDKN